MSRNPGFLDDRPTSKDELKLHNNIATTLKNILENVKDKPTKNIALFGPWGSGKSTIIKILEEQESESYEFFIFDSWSHRGDFLKRAFLLSLAKHLDIAKKSIQELEKETLDRKTIPKNKLKSEDKETLENVLNKKIISKDVTVNYRPSLKWHTKIIVLLFLISLILTSTKTATDLLGISLNSDTPIVLKVPNMTIEIELIKIIPAILMLSLLIFIVYKWEVIDELINLIILRKATVTESYLSKEDFEFSNYDYEYYFKLILANLQKRIQDKQGFIVIFDNLDRVDTEIIIDTLSLIQLSNEILNKNKINNLYFLIPIDNERLKTAILETQSGETSGKSKFAEDFLEKIFPYQTFIPNIKYSNWRKFFSNQLKEAFESHIDDNQISFIRRFLERSRINNLTPREIKAFINSLVENYLYWHNFSGKPDLLLQALYVVLKKYHYDELQKYVEGNIKMEGLNDIISIAKELYSEKEIREALIKQFYRVEDISTLFIDDAIEAIEKGDILKFQEIIKLFDDPYKAEKLVDEVIEQKKELFKDINLLLNLYKILKETGLLKKYKNIIYQSLSKVLEDSEKLIKLQDSNIPKLKELLNEYKDLRKLFSKQVGHIILTIPEGA